MDKVKKFRYISFISACIFCVIYLILALVFLITLLKNTTLLDQLIEKSGLNGTRVSPSLFLAESFIPLIWMLPLTIKIKLVVKDRYKHRTLAICALLFLGIIPGIFLIIAESKFNDMCVLPDDQTTPEYILKPIKESKNKKTTTSKKKSKSLD
ncbi:MAG: hypothetical protein Ta2E_05520 [Mycoplasmoidaceae bacterium]|nr:MAG: hypothetical protein Ta2E_05520 [Mycoplasmoidaceae bacterium]